MNEALPQWMSTLTNLFAVLLAQRELTAVLIGTVSAISITQVAKMIVIQSSLPNGGRALWYGVTTLVGLFVTVINWPTVLGFSFGLCVGGVFAPALYFIGTRTLYKFWPDLESHISATPKVIQ